MGIAPRESRCYHSRIRVFARLGTGPLGFSLFKEPVAFAAGSFCLLRVWSGRLILIYAIARGSAQRGVNHCRIIVQVSEPGKQTLDI